MDHVSSITFNIPVPTQMTNGPEKSPMGKPSQKSQKPADRIRQQQRDRLQQQKSQIEKRLKTLHMAGSIVSRFVQAQPNPNDDPNYLFGQIRPLLGKLQMANMCQNNKTKLMIGQTRKDESLYCVLLRRQAQITKDTIERLKRNDDQFEYIIWTAAGLEMYLWWTYVSPEQAAAPRTGPVPPGPAIRS
jgi:hypothetical protein